ncbi:MAG TPA: hypothetical protein VKX28_17455 [Xanthobacteraceae bacterium]|nr:hypothetical protein [Xanthobacteraceae bacterium]
MSSKAIEGATVIKIPQRRIRGVYHRRVGDIVITAISDGFLDGKVESIAPSRRTRPARAVRSNRTEQGRR